jgi:hypothetical protein
MKFRIVPVLLLLVCLITIAWIASAATLTRGPAPFSATANSNRSVNQYHAKAENEKAQEIQSILSPFPKTPPDARKISVGSPDAAGYAQVSGDPGSVPADADVVIVNLNAHNVITTTANTQGAFLASLFAPPGSSLLIKYENDGYRIPIFWQAAINGIADGTTDNLNPLPGTVIYVSGPQSSVGESQTFHAAGGMSPVEPPKFWAGWWMNGELSVPNHDDDWQLTVMPGEPVTLTLNIFATSPAFSCTGTPAQTILIDLGLREIFGEDGVSSPWDVWFDASLFTPTGLPIEHEGDVPVSELEVVSNEIQNLSCLNANVLTGDFQTTFDIPGDLPEGYYRPEFSFLPGILPSDQVPQAVVWLHSPERVEGLPILRVGNPAPARIPWLILGDELVNGQRGVPAYEDRGRYEMVNRVTTPAHIQVIPRLNERSGEIIRYNLAPGASWLSNTDRRLAPPPHIPLHYPSGQMEVVIHSPDGTVETLGPAPLQGSSVRTPTTPGGAEFAVGTGHLGDLYHLHNFDDAFVYQFQQEGVHLIELHGFVEDVFGNPYSLESTYELMVAHVLDLDPHILPTTPFTTDDHFSAGLHIFPPVPAHVMIQLTHMPNSDPTLVVTTTISGQANWAGYFHTTPGTKLPMDAAGEYRVDIHAEYHAPNGEVWFGAMTWGSVVESPNPLIEAHGRRGMDYHDDTIDDMPSWFRNQDLPPEKIGIENYYPYFSGDIHWGDQDPTLGFAGDSIHTILTFKDRTPGQTFYDVVRNQFPKATNPFRWPPYEESGLTGLEKRIAVGEAPLFITTQSGRHPELYPEEIDVWGYWYGSSQRPDVRVRELISEDNMGTAYWRFDDTYGYQIGEPANGDQPGDIKWEFGGLVLRVISETNPINQYAIYSSLWVLLPNECDDYGCARVTPPFQDATGASINGGPIMTLSGEQINMLFLPKCVRPGDILEIGDTVAFCGHVGPPLDSHVAITITSPSGAVYNGDWHANKIGWLYDPDFDFPADEAGRWTVDVAVMHDRPYIGNGVIPSNHNSGTVLGSDGQYAFYVVERDSPGLPLIYPQPGFINWSQGEIEPIPISGWAPPGTTTVYYTIHDKGIVMDQGTLTPGLNRHYVMEYDAKTLHMDFPMLSLTAREGLWEGLADEVTINFLAVGSDSTRANSVVLLGEQIFVSHSGYQINLPMVMR